MCPNFDLAISIHDRYCNDKEFFETQEDGLESTLSSFDKATPKNLKYLVAKGEGLLEKKVSTVNLENGKFEPPPNMDKSNAEALAE